MHEIGMKQIYANNIYYFIMTYSLVKYTITLVLKFQK